MEEFDRLNPFYDEFRPDAETPPPTPPLTPPPPSLSAEEEEGGDEAQETSSRKAWEVPVATLFLKRSSESTDLGTIKQLITKHSGDSNYRVKSKISKFQGYSVEDLIRARDEILRRRGEQPPQPTQSELMLRGELPPQPAQSPLDDASWERETEGSGLGAQDADKLINQLYLSLGSIKAGNTSTKLRKQVVDLLQLLIKHGMINEFQRKKIINNI